MLVFTAFVTVTTPFWQLGTVLFFLGLFMGSINSPTMNILLGSLPVDKAGISSALNTVSLYAPGSIGIAMLGSILTNIYSSHFLKAVASIQGLPAALVHEASNSVGMAVGIANSGKITQTLQLLSLGQLERASWTDGRLRLLFSASSLRWG
jgi:hypothetical protein